MPDFKKIAQRKKSFELARTMRIQELARQWGVPTGNIYTNVNWGYDDSVGVPRTATYFTFDAAGKVNNQKIDYAPVIGYPAGVYSPKPAPSSLQPTGPAPVFIMSSEPAGQEQKRSMKKGGRLRKAAWGDILPVRRPFNVSTDLENIPVSPFQTADPAIRSYFARQLSEGLVPNDASLNGPDPDSLQYMLNPATGEVMTGSDKPPQPVAAPSPSPIASGFNLNINPGALLTGMNTAINSLYDRSRGLKEFSRLKRKQLQGPGYNPHQYGTGSQAIYKHGGSVQPISANVYSSPVLQFNGPSHAEGGIPIRYGDKGVEVEGSETAYVDGRGDLNIFGDLPVPGTRIKFKTAAKRLAAAETKAATRMKKALELIAQTDPSDKFDKLRYNSGHLQAKAAQDEQQALTMLKERLSSLQEEVLASAQNSSATRADGTAIAQDGKKVLKPSVAARHNNPGNIKYKSWEKKYGAVKGELSADGDHFARFPTMEQGLRAMKALLRSPAYAGKTVEEAIKKWTGGSGYKLPLGHLQGKTVKSLSDDQLKDMMDLITRGEDSKLYDLDFLFGAEPKDPVIDTAIHPSVLPARDIPGSFTNRVPDNPPPGRKTTPVPQIPPITAPPHSQVPLQNPLQFSQIGPELLALMERPDFVPGQRYEPALYQPYQVSFQDRLNENQATFNRIAMQAGGGPSALAVLAGQKYMADAAVLADQFRTNQQISADITNKNIALLNDAQLKNLQLADTQFIRQEQAKANTRANINNAISSIAAKINQNRLETRSYNAASALFPQYMFNRQGNLQYIPNTAQQFGVPAMDGSGDDFYTRRRVEYGGNGNLRKTVLNTPSEAQQAKMDYQLWNNRLKQQAGAFDVLRRKLGFN